MILALFLGCPEVVHVFVDAPTDIDECAELCVGATVRRGGVAAPEMEVRITVDGGVLGETATTDASGRAELCTSDLSVGAHTVEASVDAASVEGAVLPAMGHVTVHGFGYADGFVRDDEALESLPYTPSFTRYEGNPVLLPGDAGTWDSVAVALPSVAATETGYAMAYAGSDGGDYVIGSATSLDGAVWTRDSSAPLLTGSGVEGDWKRYSVNSPMIVKTPDEWELFYDGRAEETGNINIGLAAGASLTTVADVSDAPVFSWTADEEPWAGKAVAHPSILVNDQGFWELWYSTGLQKIGYAYSADGRSWSRYCRNPVFIPDDASTWENGTVKAAEVIQTADGYAMTYSGGGMGTFQVGWAMSHDGLHWQRSATPILSPTGNDWEKRAALSAPLLVVGSQLWMWYTGTDGVGSSIGLAKAAGIP